MRRDQKRGPPPPPQRVEPPEQSRWAAQRRGDGPVPAGVNVKLPNELSVPPQYHEPQHPRYPHQHYPVPTRQGYPAQQPPTPGSLRGFQPGPPPAAPGANSRPSAEYYQQANPPPPPEPVRAPGLPFADVMPLASAFAPDPAAAAAAAARPGQHHQQRQQQASPLRVQRQETSQFTMEVARRAAGARKAPSAAKEGKPTDGMPVAFAVALPVRRRTPAGRPMPAHTRSVVFTCVRARWAD